MAKSPLSLEGVATDAPCPSKALQSKGKTCLDHSYIIDLGYSLTQRSCLGHICQVVEQLTVCRRESVSPVRLPIS